MAEIQCPVCKNDSYLNPGIKMYVSPCFHKICESCLYKIFQQGYAPCPDCGTLLRRINFISSTFEDVEVERELKMRKLLNRHFLKHEDDFASELDYNDYLEEYENILSDLLDLENEGLVRDKINLIKNSASCLNLNQNNKREVELENEVKRAKQSDSKWCKYEEFISDRIKLDEKIVLPKGFFNQNLPGGQTKRIILDFLEFSLIRLTARD
jgi:CDK-activating kinase assembly factor MAT1